MSLVNLLDLSKAALEAFVLGCGQPAYRARQLARWVHARRVVDFDQMTDISQVWRAELKKKACIVVPETVLCKQSADGTCKWLFRLTDGSVIETVYIPEKTRGTLCISSQVGCALNCSFCATGKAGFRRNLTVSEIIGQLWIALQTYKITNVVMMGMGEPLLNYENVVSALAWMLDDQAYGLSKYRVTVSTSGVVPQMLTLKQDLPVSLAVSLHAPDNALRAQLVPLNRKYPLEVLLPVCRDYFPPGARQKILFEYVMLSGVNDTLEHARVLKQKLAAIPCKINLIPFNPFQGTRYTASSPECVARFQRYLMEAGFNTRVRRERGSDIAGACGQLSGNFTDKTGRHARWLKTGSLVPILREGE